MASWADLRREQPELASAGRSLLYQHGVGLAFLATVGADGAPRVNPMCPILADGDVYAFRDNGGPTAGRLYKSTTGGWSLVPLGYRVAFTSGGTTEITEGQTVTGGTSGATATVRRVIVQSGDWEAGDAAGYFVLSDVSGTFAAENLNVGASPNLATIAGIRSQEPKLDEGRRLLETAQREQLAALEAVEKYEKTGDRAFIEGPDGYVARAVASLDRERECRDVVEQYLRDNDLTDESDDAEP